MSDVAHATTDTHHITATCYQGDEHREMPSSWWDDENRVQILSTQILRSQDSCFLRWYFGAHHFYTTIFRAHKIIHTIFVHRRIITYIVAVIHYSMNIGENKKIHCFWVGTGGMLRWWKTPKTLFLLSSHNHEETPYKLVRGQIRTWGPHPMLFAPSYRGFLLTRI